MFYDSKLVMHDCYHGEPSPVYMIEGTSSELCKRVGRELRKKYDAANTDAVYWYSFMDTTNWMYPYSNTDEFVQPNPLDKKCTIDKVMCRAANATSHILTVAEMLNLEANERIVLDTNFFRCIIDAIHIGTENINWIFEINRYPLSAIIPTAIFYVVNESHRTHNMDKIKGWYSAYLAEMRSHTNVCIINGANPMDQIIADIEYEINKIEEKTL